MATTPVPQDCSLRGDYHYEVKTYTGRWDHDPPLVRKGDVIRVPNSGAPWRLENQPDAREWHNFHAAVRAAGLLPVLTKTVGEWDYFTLEKT